MPTPSEFLAVNNAGDVDALALKVYAGMVLNAYNQKQTTDGRHIGRHIASGKSAQFPATGLAADPSFHTPGAEVTFSVINSAETVIAIQGLLISAIFIDKLDEAKSHFEIRAEYAKQQGEVLANQSDLRVLMAFAAGSIGSVANPVTGLPAGSGVATANTSTSATVLKGSIYEAAEILDTNNVPTDERYLWLAPAQYYLLLQDGEFLDRDFGGAGDRVNAVSTRAAGFDIVRTNNLPSTDRTGDGDFPSDLQVDYSDLVAIAGHKSAVGSVTLLDLQMETEYDVSTQGTELVAGYAKGYGYLRPEASVALSDV